MNIDRRCVEIDGKRYGFDTTEDCPCYFMVYGGHMCTHPGNEREDGEAVKKCRFFMGAGTCPARKVKEKKK